MIIDRQLTEADLLGLVETDALKQTFYERLRRGEGVVRFSWTPTQLQGVWLTVDLYRLVVTSAERPTHPMRQSAVALPLVLALIVTAGCGSGGPAAASPTTASTSTSAASATVIPAAPATASVAATTAAPSGLLAMMLTDVRSGESFSLAQFEGKVTIVQHMAVW